MPRALILVALLLLTVPVDAFAQASITGVVRDASGAVLPGVTVEQCHERHRQPDRTGHSVW
jgi:hypothetical protein